MRLLKREQNLNLAPIKAVFQLQIEARCLPQPPLPGRLLFIERLNLLSGRRIQLPVLEIAVLLGKALFQRLNHALIGDLRIELAEIANPGAHRGNPLAFELCVRDIQIPRQLREIRREQKRPMVLAAFAPHAKCIARKLLPLSQQIVSAAELGLDAQLPHRAQDDIHLPGDVVNIPMRDEGKIHIAQIVIHRAAAADSAHQLDAIRFHCLQIAFTPGILIFADDHSRGIDIDIKQNLIFADMV